MIAQIYFSNNNNENDKREYCKVETKSKNYYIEELIKSMQLKMQDETLPMAASKTKKMKTLKTNKNQRFALVNIVAA